MTDEAKSSICNLKNILILSLVLIQVSHLISQKKLSVLISQALPPSIISSVEIQSSNQSLSTVLTTAVDRIIPNVEQKKFPNWMLAIDCSSYDLNCVSHRVASQRYAPYPFSFENQQDFNEITQDQKKPSWWGTNESFPLRHTLDDKRPYTLNKYPERVTKKEYDACVDVGLHKSYEEQLSKMLKSMEKGKELGVSFTISDYNYAYDMIHAFFQMSWQYLTFGRDSMFMVALDEKTLKLACRHGYPVMMMPSANKGESEKVIVQNTKFLVSRDIVEHGYSFIFSEMDVWFIQSPMTIIKNLGDFDVAVSGHQDNPNAANIGFYAARSNNRTKEFFRELYHLMELNPNVFDQFAFGELWRISEPWNKEKGNFTNAERWRDSPPPIPKLQHKMQNQVVLGGTFAAQAWPNINENTVAVHVLCGQPLSTPNGKKMIAKELGAWYGFHSEPKENDMAGYYLRTGEKNRRYLMLDGYSWMSLDMQNDDIYHHDEALTMIITFLVVVARQTERILILPKVFHDRCGAFLWTALDLKSMEDIVEFRETNFMNNPKSWFSDTQPFQSVARTALSSSGDDMKLFSQAKESEDVKAWRFPRNRKEFQLHFIDIWFKLITSKGFDDAELLLLNPHFFRERRHEFYNYDEADFSPIVNEFWKLYSQRIKWCVEGEYNGVQGKLMQSWPVAQTAAEDDCYGKGQLVDDKKWRQNEE